MPDPNPDTLARSLWITGERRCALQVAPLGTPAADEVVVRSLFGAISRGTERLVFENRVPVSEHERMRGPSQEGAFPFPVKYGYAVVGRVDEGPADWLGRLVFTLHPHQDRFAVPVQSVVALPEGVPAERAVLAANMETALNIVWDAAIQPGDRVAIVGGGLVGLLVGALCARIPAVDSLLVDVDHGRKPVAEALDLRFAVPGALPDDFDVVIHVSGSPAGLDTAIAMAGFEARIVEASWYGEGAVPVSLGGAFHSRRLAIVASQVGTVPPARRARWTHRRRLEAALALLADSRLDRLVSGETAFEDLAERYEAILAAPETLCHRIVYERS